MAILLVTYDLKKPGQDYSDFISTFKKYAWARLSESCYAIDTYKTPNQIYNELKPFMDQNDQVYIITLSNPWDGYGPKDVNDWLHARL